MGDTFWKLTGDFWVGPKIWSWLNPEQKQNVTPVDSGTPQGADYGGTIQTLYGRNAVQGNIVWLENNQIEQRVVKVKVQGGGKGGGGKSKTKEIHCYATFAMVLGIPADGALDIVRVWCSEKLIYSGRLKTGESVQVSVGGEAATMVMYGGDQSVTDPRMEADLGTANCPDYAGLAYVVFYDFPLKSFGNSLQGTAFKFDCDEAGLQYADPHWNNVILLLDFDQVDGNTTFACQKTGRAFTTVGSAATSNLYTEGGYNYGHFAGTGNYIYASAPDSTFLVPALDYTLDARVKITASGGNIRHVFDTCQLNSYGGGWRNTGFTLYFDNGVPKVFVAGGNITFGANMSAGGGVWNFGDTIDVRLTYQFIAPSSGTWTLAINNTVGTTTNTGYYTLDGTVNDQTGISVGVIANLPATATGEFWVRKLRVTKGIARGASDYTLSHSPTPYNLQSGRGTYQHLTEQLLFPARVDKFANLYTSLIHFNGINTSTVFNDDVGIEWSSISGAIISTEKSKFGMSSGKFNGSSSYLTTITTDSFNLSNKDFTIDAWIYPISTGAGQHDVFSVRDNSNHGFTFGLYNDHLIFWASGTGNCIGSTTITPSVWTHIMAVRTSGTLRLYVNGDLDGTFTLNTIDYSSSYTTRIGGNVGPFWGHIDEFRFVNNYALPAQLPIREYRISTDSTSVYGSELVVDTSTGIFIAPEANAIGAILTNPPRQLLDQVQKIYNYDIVCSGYELKCVLRQNETPTLDFVIPNEHIIPEGSNGRSIDLEYEMGTQLPQDYMVSFRSIARDFDNENVPSSFPRVDSGNIETFQSPIVMDFAQGRALADDLRRRSWQEKNICKFKLPFKALHPTTLVEVQYQNLEPADVIQLETADGTVLTLLVKAVKESAGKIELECAIATSAATKITEVSFPISTPPAFTPQTKGLILDIPAIHPDMDKLGVMWAACPSATGPWNGANLYRDIGSANYSIVDTTGIESIMAVCVDSLSAHTGNLVDVGHSLTVTPIEADLALESTTKELMFAGTNTAAYGVDGRWEIIRFQNATLNMDGTYTLDNLLRGLYGTEWATGLHAIGDYFVMLEADAVGFFSTTSDVIGIAFDYKAVSYNTDIADATTISAQSYDAVNLKPYAGCQGKGSRDGSANFAGSWTRRTRVDGGWRSGTDVPLNEATESYEIDVMNGSTVVRTIASTATNFTYSAADQTTDFGSAQSSITFRIYQISAIVGRGYPYEVTL